MNDVGPHSGDRATDEAPTEPVDAEELRQGLIGLREGLASARTELADARRQLTAVATREARSQEAGDIARLPFLTRVRLHARRLLHRLRRATGRVLVRLSPEAVLPFVWHNPLFDASWYREHNPDVRDQGLAPERHYRRHGAIEGRDPNAFFDTSWYLARYPDVAGSGINPLDHYLLYGADDLRDPSPWFDPRSYLASNPDVRLLGMDPLLHYIRHGVTEGRDPRPRGRAHRAGLRPGTVWAGAKAGSTPARQPRRTGPVLPGGLPADQPVALVVDDKAPRMDRDAGSVLTQNYLQLLQELGYHVLFVSTHDDKDAAPYRDALSANGVTVLDATGRRLTALELLETAGPSIELAYLSRVNSGGAYIEDVIRHCPDARIVFNTVDLHYLREERASQLAGNRLGMYAAAAMREREVLVTRLADATIVVSSVEKTILEDSAPGARVYWCPLIQDVVGRSSGFAARSGVAFIGGYRHQPNVDALRYFLDDIWPAVRTALPGIQFFGIGPDMPRHLSQRAGEGFVAVGHVDELGPWLERVRLTVAPLRFGAGVKGKVLSSLAHGVPCIMTTVSAEGMDAVEAGSIIVDDAPAFAEQVVRLHEDARAWREYSDAGMTWIDSNVSLASGRQRFHRLLADIGVSLPAQAALASDTATVDARDAAA